MYKKELSRVEVGVGKLEGNARCWWGARGGEIRQATAVIVVVRHSHTLLFGRRRRPSLIQLCPFCKTDSESESSIFAYRNLHGHAVPHSATHGPHSRLHSPVLWSWRRSGVIQIQALLARSPELAGTRSQCVSASQTSCKLDCTCPMLGRSRANRLDPEYDLLPSLAV